ncbi:hypothetical protein P43SY_004154 [Pythium insidiosum]|uniref:Croquemort-like mating protein M82 n=1 Tax=Pythium insidiosum TaxID=114742 RepID=A0AAD5LBZ7_PYTIN|nr:hypothetical protein P43SY_004154 [Pythium insidiosum]KAJ0396511.1 hypothetical protein ATCC90586_006597 [Pythium insidiosum]
MKDQGPITPGSVNEAYEKTAATPVPKFDDGMRRKKGCSPIAIGYTFVGIGALLLVIGIAFGVALPPVVTNKIKDGVSVCKQSDIEKESFLDSYGDCKDCVPYYFSLTMFNVTNAEDYLANGAKLKVQEVGPYAYRRRQFKVDVKLEEGNKILSYKTYTYHTFVQEKSCSGCSDTDEVISWDVGYLNVISSVGGEHAYLRKVAAGSWGATKTAEEIDEVIKEDGAQMMRWINGLNANQPKAWKKLSPTILMFLAGGPAAIKSLDLSGFEYNGLFAKRPISDWALGYPSLLAGLSLGSNYVKVCKPGKQDGMEYKCKNCSGEECLPIAAECRRCALGAKILAINDVTCATVEKKYAAVYGDAEAATFRGQTCGGYCKDFGLCAAPLPGAAESSGLDFSKQAPPASSLNTYAQYTGCDDKTRIYEYLQYDGIKTQPFWAQLDSRRNPTLQELIDFGNYANCQNPLPNVTCSDVLGNDATSLEPLGAGLSGFADKVKAKDSVMYLSQAKQNITLINTGEVHDDIAGIPLTRFIPPNDLLNLDPIKEKKGTGYPVNGVQPLAFSVGFLAYLSYPMYMFGDKSLTENIEITMFDGQIASPETLLENGKLKKPYYDRYQTIVDIEPATGKTMRAFKRLQASYALGRSLVNPKLSMSDLVWPKVKPEIISPAYIGEESAVITKARTDTYKSISGLLGAVLPVMIVGIILGLILIAGGFFYRRRALSQRKTPVGDAI